MFYFEVVSTNWSPLHSFYKYVSKGCREKKTPTRFRFSPPQHTAIVVTHDICRPRRELSNLFCRLGCRNQLRKYTLGLTKFNRHLICHYFANQLTYGYWANIDNPFVKNLERPHGFWLRQQFALSACFPFAKRNFHPSLTLRNECICCSRELEQTEPGLITDELLSWIC